jgi:hypothetical protein
MSQDVKREDYFKQGEIMFEKTNNSKVIIIYKLKSNIIIKEKSLNKRI